MLQLSENPDFQLDLIVEIFLFDQRLLYDLASHLSSGFPIESEMDHSV